MSINSCLFGDCRESMRKMIAEGVKVQACVTSPPYFGLRSYLPEGHTDKCNELGLEQTPQEYVSNMVEVFGLVRKLLANNGTCWINLGDSFSKNKQLLGIPWRVAFALQDDGWILRQDIIWNKKGGMPESATDRCTKSHEYIFLLSKSEKYYFDHEAIKEPIAESSINRLKQNVADQVGSMRVPGKTNGNMKAVGNGETRNKRSVWEVATQPYSGCHFATFPPALIEPCILAGSRINDIVFDPFLGSGTTAQVSQRLGRKWIGCELNPTNTDLQNDRTRQNGLLLEAIA